MFTIYFKTGFETLEPVATKVEKACNRDVGVGSNFLNVYSTDLIVLGEAIKAIGAWQPHQQTLVIDEIAGLDQEEE